MGKLFFSKILIENQYDNFLGKKTCLMLVISPKKSYFFVKISLNGSISNAQLGSRNVMSAKRANMKNDRKNIRIPRVISFKTVYLS